MNTAMNNQPRTMGDFLKSLREQLNGSDPAMIQDALFDSEDYLRAAIADNAALSESEVMEKVLAEYGTPEEVAANYRATEVTVQKAIKPLATAGAAATERSLLKRIFGVFTDPYAYGGLLYMLLSLWAGIFYFTYVVTGASISIGTIILIFGIPLLILFLGSVRILALVEGRIVETLLGVRMPRRPAMPINRDGANWIERIKGFFTDVRTWSAMLYMLLMLPLGIVYFTVAITLLAIGVAFILSPFAALLGETRIDGVVVDPGSLQFMDWQISSWAALPIVVPMGVAALLLLLHIARWVGKLHGVLAKNLLVKRA